LLSKSPDEARGLASGKNRWPKWLICRQTTLTFSLNADSFSLFLTSKTAVLFLAAMPRMAAIDVSALWAWLRFLRNSSAVHLIEKHPAGNESGITCSMELTNHGRAAVNQLGG
jgi:hypothetical protein